MTFGCPTPGERQGLWRRIYRIVAAPGKRCRCDHFRGGTRRTAQGATFGTNISPTGDGNGVRRSGCRSVGARVSCELPSWGLWGGSGGEAVGGVVPGAGAGRGVGRGAGGDFGGGSRRRCRRRPRPGWRPLPGSAKAVRTAPPRMGQPCPAGESTPIEFLLGREVRCLVELELLRTRAARLLQLPHEPPPQVYLDGLKRGIMCRFAPGDVIVYGVLDPERRLLGYLSVEFDEMSIRRPGSRGSSEAVPIAEWILCWSRTDDEGEPFVDGRAVSGGRLSGPSKGA